MQIFTISGVTYTFEILCALANARILAAIEIRAERGEDMSYFDDRIAAVQAKATIRPRRAN